MTTPHLSSPQLEQYRSGTLPGLELLAADDHLSSCDQCRGRLAALLPVNRLAEELRDQLRPAPSDDHLSFEALTAFIDGTDDEDTRGIVNGHVEVCAACAEELESLAAFTKTLDPAPAPASAPRALAPSNAAGVARPRVRTPPPSSATRLRVPSPPSRGPRLLPLLAAAALVVVAFVLATSYRDGGQQPSPVAASEQTVPPDATAASGTSPDSIAPEPVPVVALADGGALITLDEDGKIAGIALDDEADRKLLRAALTSGRPEIDPGVLALRAERGTLMSGGDQPSTFELVAPVGTAVQTDRPTFRWKTIDGASAYRVGVFDADFNQVADSGRLASGASRWTCDRALPAGTYSWQAVARLGDDEVRSPIPPAPEAKFLVLDTATADEVRRQLARHPESPLLRGLVLARAGLIEEAQQELRAVEQANPESAVAGALLRNLSTEDERP